MYTFSFVTSTTVIIVAYDFDLMNENFALLIDTLLYTTPHVLCWVLFRKTPKIADLIFIRQEMRLLNIGVLGTIIFYFLSIIIFGVFLNSYFWPITVASSLGASFHCMFSSH